MNKASYQFQSCFILYYTKGSHGTFQESPRATLRVPRGHGRKGTNIFIFLNFFDRYDMLDREKIGVIGYLFSLKEGENPQNHQNLLNIWRSTDLPGGLVLYYLVLFCIIWPCFA